MTKLVIFINENEPITATIYKDSLRSSEIKGGDSNKLFNEYVSEIKEVRSEMQKMVAEYQKNNPDLIKKIYGELEDQDKTVEFINPETKAQTHSNSPPINQYDYAETVIEEEPLSLLEKEIEMIKQALKRSNGKRKIAANELGISERTLYRKIKQFDLQDDENE